MSRIVIGQVLAPNDRLAQAADFNQFIVSEEVAHLIRHEKWPEATDHILEGLANGIYNDDPDWLTNDSAALVFHIYGEKSITGARSKGQILEQLTTPLISAYPGASDATKDRVFGALSVADVFGLIDPAKGLEPQDNISIEQIIMLDTLLNLREPPESQIPLQKKRRERLEDCRAKLAKRSPQAAAWKRGKFDWSQYAEKASNCWVVTANYGCDPYNPTVCEIRAMRDDLMDRPDIGRLVQLINGGYYWLGTTRVGHWWRQKIILEQGSWVARFTHHFCALLAIAAKRLGTTDTS